MKEKVLITGTGCITPLGKGVASNWEALFNKKNGIQSIDNLLNNQKPGIFAARLREEFSRDFTIEGRSFMSLQNSLLLWSVQEAWQQSGLGDFASLKDSRCCVYVANGAISVERKTLEIFLNCCNNRNNNIDLKEIGKNIERLPPLESMKMLPTAASHFIAKLLQVHGAGNPICNGYTSSVSALIHAMHAVAEGDTDVAIVASAEAPFVPHTYAFLSALGILVQEHDPMNAAYISRPCDKESRGIVLSEGAACCIIESQAHALKRKATALATLVGGSNTTLVNTQNLLELTEEGFIENIDNSLNCSGVTKHDIDVVFPFCPSYSKWDIAELSALQKMFKESSCKIISAKGNLGFLGSASGLLDVILAQQALYHQKIFGMKNFVTVPDPIDASFNYFINQENAAISSQNCLVMVAGVGGFYGSIVLQKTQ